jgi:small subunit ribosomal protein S9
MQEDERRDNEQPQGEQPEQPEQPEAAEEQTPPEATEEQTPPEATEEQTPPEAESSEEAPAEAEAADQAPPAAEGEEVAAAEETEEIAAAEETEEVETAEEIPDETPAEPQVRTPAKDAPPGAELEPITLEPQRELSAEERARLEAEAEERARAEALATAETGDEPGPAREAVVDLDADARIQATGKRKTSIARVVLRSGSGDFEINKRTLEDYFPRHQHQTFVRQPLLTSGYEGKVDIRVRVHGGGIAGQAGAVRHGIARALTEIDPELRGELKTRGLLTRDARAKERRKAGLKKARKRPQFSKR